MAVCVGEQRRWHTNLTVLSRLSGECVDNFVSQQSIAKETSVRGYKFFLENYIHDVQGTLCNEAFCGCIHTAIPTPAIRSDDIWVMSSGGGECCLQRCGIADYPFVVRLVKRYCEIF